MPKKRAAALLKTNDLVQVTWDDANTRSGWLDHHEAIKHDTAKITSVGFVMLHNKTTLLLSQSVATDRQVLGVLAIPSGWITSTRRLK